MTKDEVKEEAIDSSVPDIEQDDDSKPTGVRSQASIRKKTIPVSW